MSGDGTTPTLGEKIYDLIERNGLSLMVLVLILFQILTWIEVRKVADEMHNVAAELSDPPRADPGGRARADVPLTRFDITGFVSARP
jgi:hypothetical protein